MKKLFALSAMTVMLAACQGAGTDEDPIKVGYIGPLTGDAAAYGVDTLNGARMKIDEINAAGGIDGRMIELIAEDGRCTGSDAASAAQKLIHIDNVVAIVGGQCSGETLAVAPIAEAAEVVVISPVSSSPDVTDAGDFIFRDYPSDALKTTAMAQYFGEQEYGKVAAISENTDFCIAFRDALKGALAEDAVTFDQVDEPGSKDYRTTLTRMQESELDVFFPNGQTPATAAAMVQQYREFGFEQPIVSHDVLDTEAFVEAAGEAAEGVITISVPAVSSDTDFGKKYIAEFGDAQSGLAFVAHAYDAAGVLAQAFKAVGTEGPAVRDYLYKMNGYKGIVGKFTFNEDGDVVGIPYVLRQVQDGVFTEIDKIELK